MSLFGALRTVPGKDRKYVFVLFLYIVVFCGLVPIDLLRGFATYFEICEPGTEIIEFARIFSVLTFSILFIIAGVFLLFRLPLACLVNRIALLFAIFITFVSGAILPWIVLSDIVCLFYGMTSPFWAYSAILSLWLVFFNKSETVRNIYFITSQKKRPDTHILLIFGIWLVLFVLFLGFYFATLVNHGEQFNLQSIGWYIYLFYAFICISALMCLASFVTLLRRHVKYGLFILTIAFCIAFLCAADSITPIELGDEFLYPELFGAYSGYGFLFLPVFLFIYFIFSRKIMK